ncbi:UPF0750 membrane protein YvjA [Collibacillus ludicampi]|uniref:UPF0750 membrane protein YvjA n=2 Tax=Collibacillus ludicampi TaxID=2771369 RepID=A0AAV4LCC1_9BACL|nr:UPF0750 membrane protein YvjA [Collibacillus ludicampi]
MQDRIDVRRNSWIREYLLMSVGALILSIAVNWIFIPNKTVTGGVSGIGILLYYTIGLPITYSQLLFNIPLFIAGVKWLGGKTFGVKTLYGILTLTFFLWLTEPLIHHPLTTNPLLASIYGGLTLGLAIGLVFRAQGSTGGTDLLARLFQKATGVSPGVLLLFIDGSIIASAGIIFNVERILYALISLFVTSKTIDFIQQGFSQAKLAYIISRHDKELQDAVLFNLNRGITRLTGVGGYTGEERPIFMCVVQQSEVSKLKNLVREVDPQAFVIVTDAHEVLGEGFTRLPVP